MADYTSSLFLSIIARDLTAAGVAGARRNIASVRTATAEQTTALRMEAARQVAATREGAYQQSVAIARAATRDTAVVADAGRQKLAHTRLSAQQQVFALQDAARGQDRAAQDAARLQIRAVRDGAAQQLATTSRTTREQVAMVRAGALQASDAVRAGAMRDVATIDAANRQRVVAVRKNAARQEARAGRGLGGGALAGMGGLLAMAGAGAAVAFTGSSIKAASSFNSMTQSVANNTTLGVKGLAQMRASITDLAAHSPAQLDDLAQAYMHISNYGNNAKDTQLILRAAMESAVSTHTKVAGVANTLANAMHEYSLRGIDAAHAMDVLHLAAAQGNATLEQFTSGGARSIDMAANLGISMNTVTAALSALSRHESLRDANTQLVGLFSKIVNPAQSAQKEIAALSLKTGVNLVNDFTAAGLRTRGLTGVMNDLKAATGGNTAEIFKLVPALRGGLGAMLLTGTGTKDYRDILTSLNNVQKGMSPTAAAYAASQKTAAFSMGTFKNQVQLAKIAIGNALLPTLQSLTAWASARGPAALHTFQGALAAMSTAARTGAGFVRAHAQQIGFLFNVLKPVAAIIGPMVLAFMAYNRVLGIAKGVQIAFNIVMDANPIGIVALALAGLVGGVIYAYTHVKGFHDLVNNLWSFLSSNLGPVFSLVANAAQRVFAGAIDVAHQHAGQFLSLVTTAATFLAHTFGPTIRTVAGVFLTVWVVQIKAGVAIVQTLWDLGTRVVGWMGGTLIPAVGRAAGAFSGTLHGAIAGASKIVQGLWDKFTGFLGFLGSKLPAGLTAAASSFTNTIGKAIGGIVDAVSSLTKGIGGLLALLGHKVSTFGLDQITGAFAAAKAYADSPPSRARAVTTVPGVGVVDARLRLWLARDAQAGAGATGTGGRGRGGPVIGPPVPRGYGVFGPPAPGSSGDVSHLDAAGRRRAQDIMRGGKPDKTGYDAALTHYRVVEALYKGHQATMAQVTAALTALGRAERGTPGLKGGANIRLLTAQLSSTEHGRNEHIRHHAATQDLRTRHHNDVIRHAAAAAQQRTARRADAIRHHGAVIAQRAQHHAQVVAHHAAVMAAHARAHAQRVAHATLLTDLRGQLTVAQRQEGVDKRAGNRPAALADIARIVNLDRRYEVARTGNKALSDQLATSLGARLTASLDQAQRRGLSLVAPRASGLARGAYGLYPRTTPGQAAEFGTTTAAFGRSGDTGQAAIIRLLTAQLDTARQQADYYKRKYDQDEALLVVGTQTRDGVRALASGIGRGPITPVTDPLRLTGSPRPARAG